MANRNKDRLDKLSSVLPPAEDEAVATSTKSAPRILADRGNRLSKLASGEQRTVQHLKCPPERIRLWQDHNRNYDLLSTQRCADLIDGFRRTGHQEFPAIVRRVTDDKNFDYEVICGARRHWTAAHLGWPLLIEVRDLNDRQAFLLQDLENRDREDISDYERALDYQRALPKHFGDNRADMAKFLEIDKSNFRRLLDLAELPKPLVEAYRDLRELRVHHGTAYGKIMANPEAKRRLLDRARTLKGDELPGAKLFAELKKSAAPAKKATASGGETRYGEILVKPANKGRGVTITLPKPEPGGRFESGQLAALRKGLDEIIKDMGSGKL